MGGPKLAPNSVQITVVSPYQSAIDGLTHLRRRTRGGQGQYVAAPAVDPWFPERSHSVPNARTRPSVPGRDNAIGLGYPPELRQGGLWFVQRGCKTKKVTSGA